MNNIKSMTGFGSAKGITPASNLEVNIRSVNGRFLETRVHLPRELSGIEADVKKMLGACFQRGSIDVFVSRKSRGEKSNLKLYLHEEMAQAWLATSVRLNALASCNEKIDLKTLLQLPEVVGFEEEVTSIEQDADEVRRLVKEACESCTVERRREGEALKLELLGILSRLDESVQQMNTMREEINRLLRERMESRLKARWSELDLDVQRLQQELAILWDKADITEEMGRLKEHLHHYRNLLLASDAQGKKLDFYTQELLREVNTIGSKSPLAQLTHLVVTAKTEIEKLREQVQNIE
jgi:uncharacterized protein (TIGR00255 family)